MFVVQAVLGHRGAVPGPSIFRSGVRATVDVGDRAVPEGDEVVDRLPGADRVIVADHVDAAVA